MIDLSHRSHKKEIIMSKKILILTLTLCLFVMLCGLLPIHGEENIYNTVLRLHVIANSDSDEDQSLKLAVRDAILAESAELFGECGTREEAVKAVGESREEIQRIAEETVAAHGYDHAVNIELSVEEYPTKNYESFCFPAGEYLSLRVEIGEAAGQNWWCVLFPPLCLDAATASGKTSAEDAFISVGLNAEEYKIITETDSPKYQIRFKLLETIEGILK